MRCPHCRQRFARYDCPADMATAINAAGGLMKLIYDFDDNPVIWEIRCSWCQHTFHRTIKQVQDFCMGVPT